MRYALLQLLSNQTPIVRRTIFDAAKRINIEVSPWPLAHVTTRSTAGSVIGVQCFTNKKRKSDDGQSGISRADRGLHRESMHHEKILTTFAHGYQQRIEEQSKWTYRWIRQ